MSSTGRVMRRAVVAGLIAASAAVAVGALRRHHNGPPAGVDDGRHDVEPSTAGRNADRPDEAVGWISVNGHVVGDRRQPTRSPVGTAASADDSSGS